MRDACGEGCGTPGVRGPAPRGAGGRRRGVRPSVSAPSLSPRFRGWKSGIPPDPYALLHPVKQRSSAPPERPHISGPYAVLPPATQRNTAPAERPHLSGPYAVLHPVTQRNVVIGRNLRDMPCSGSGPTHPTIHHPMCAGHPGDRPGPRPPNPRNMPWSTSHPTCGTLADQRRTVGPEGLTSGNLAAPRTGARGRGVANPRPPAPQNMPWSTPHPTYRTIHHPMRAGHPGDRPEPRPPNPRNMPWSTSRPTYPTFRRPTQDGRARGADAGASRCVENRSTGVLRQDPEQKGYAPRSGAERSCAEIRSREGVSR